MFFGAFGKFGGLTVCIPEPVVGGVFFVVFPMITAVGLSSLHYVDLNSNRNLLVLGVSIFCGLAIPKWLVMNPDVIQTGEHTVDQILTVLLQTSVLVGGLLGFILDTTIPGTPEERGLLKWNAHLQNPENEEEAKVQSQQLNCYNLPFGMDAIKKSLGAVSF
ncbi:solute carrier family 23 member 1-like isoform X2 [Homarus americanus]|uniref:solute carrier family 23 member 1-like isoform X2 n=1 Tax=Homarus americanus TaxID=6706 RepID=UPI001C452677|nr:solute carrier family 23 member 1-like isoform X2 [Homarus americanus]